MSTYRFARIAAPAVLSLALVSTLVVRTSAAAFTADTSNDQNAFRSGEVALDNSASGALFDVRHLVPGAVETRCVTVTYGGGLPADRLTPVKVRGTMSGPTNPLANALRVTVEEGTGSTANGSCSNFQAVGAPIVPDVPLSTFVTTTPGVGTWQPDGAASTRAYRVRVSLPAGTGNEAQNRTLDGVSLVWEIASAS